MGISISMISVSVISDGNGNGNGNRMGKKKKMKTVNISHNNTHGDLAFSWLHHHHIKPLVESGGEAPGQFALVYARLDL
jgi:hypothetical protein